MTEFELSTNIRGIDIFLISILIGAGFAVGYTFVSRTVARFEEAAWEDFQHLLQRLRGKKC